MKTSVLVRLHHRTDSDGRRALMLRVIRDRRSSTYSLPYRLLPEEFDRRRECAVARNRTRAHRAFIAEVNGRLGKLRRELHAIVRSLEASGRPFTAADITTACRHNSDMQYVGTFAGMLIAELEEAGRFGTARSYRSLLSALNGFPGAVHLRFGQIDPRSVASFADYLERRGNRRNTVTFYLRTLRALYDRARRMGFAPDANPFREISFKPALTPKLAVTRRLLQELASADFGDGELNEARDMFLFSFFARGMSFVDMAYLSKDAICDGTLHHGRLKTHQAINVAITPQMQAILDRYDDPASPWALPCMKRGCRSVAEEGKGPEEKDAPARLYAAYRHSLEYYTGLLGEVSSRLGCRKLTFNVARHTWATLARKMGIPVPYISEGLGHSSERTTRIYLASLDSSTVDRVNEEVTRL